MVGDQHRRRRVRVQRPASTAGATRSSRPPRSSPAAGSSSSSNSGSVINARAISVRLRSPSDSVPNSRSARCPTPNASSSSRARRRVERVVLLAPAADHRVTRAHHDVEDLLLSRARGWRSRPSRNRSCGRSSNTSTRPSCSPSRCTVPVDGCSSAPAIRRRGGFARAVAAEDDPALVQLDVPVHARRAACCRRGARRRRPCAPQGRRSSPGRLARSRLILSSALYAGANRGCPLRQECPQVDVSGAGVVTDRMPSVSALSS